MYTDTRIRSLKPHSSLSGQDVILPVNQVHRGSAPSEGVRSSEPAVAATHYAPRVPRDTCFALPARVSPRQADRVLQGRSCKLLAAQPMDLSPTNLACIHLFLGLACDTPCASYTAGLCAPPFCPPYSGL